MWSVVDEWPPKAKWHWTYRRRHPFSIVAMFKRLTDLVRNHEQRQFHFVQQIERYGLFAPPLTAYFIQPRWREAMCRTTSHLENDRFSPKAVLNAVAVMSSAFSVSLTMRTMPESKRWEYGL